MSKLIAALLLLVWSVSAQSGGPFSITQSVIAGGGTQDASGGLYSLKGTIGQAAAGTESTGGYYRIRGGFWAESPLAPTAAPVTISGRITTARDRGIRNVRVTLTYPSGEMRVAFTGSFGYYAFHEVPAGSSYIITAEAKHYTFAQSSVHVNAFDDITGVDFVSTNR
jgi:hypothetical protein